MFTDREKHLYLLIIMLLLPLVIALPSCTGSGNYRDRVPGGTLLPAEPASDTSEAETEPLFSEIREDSEKLMKIKSILSNIDEASPEDVAGCMALYDSLPDGMKSSVSFEEYRKLAYAEYKAVHGEILESINNHKQDVLAAVAMAYYNQSYASRKAPPSAPQILYDQYNVRRNFNPLPEDATAQRNLYLDCSSFVNSVYYYTFGANLLSGGRSVTTSNINREMSSKPVGSDLELMRYITGDELAAYQESDEKAAVEIERIKKMLQPGDIINYYRASSGHVIMYLGDGKFIHSTGSANPKTSTGLVDPGTSLEKSTADEERFGTVNIDSWDRFFTRNVTPKSQDDGRSGTSNNYLFRSGMSAIAVFRPLNEKNGRMKDMALTKESISRYIYQGLDIEKSAEVKHGAGTRRLFYGNSLYTGDEVCFTVRIYNSSDTVMRSLSVTETIPSVMRFVESSEGSAYFEKDGAIAAHISSLGAGDTYEFRYTLRVCSDAPAGSDVDDSETYVNGIRTNRIFCQISATELSSHAFEESLKAAEGSRFSDGLDAVKSVYGKINASCPFDSLNGFKSLEDVIKRLFPSNVSDFTSSGGNIAVRVLYGGYNVGSAEITAANASLDYDTYNLRARRVMEQYLSNGDVIVTYSEYYKRFDCRIYYSGSIYGLHSDGTFGQIEPLEICSGGKVQDYLDTLTAYNAFVILRPSLAG